MKSWVGSLASPIRKTFSLVESEKPAFHTNGLRKNVEKAFSAVGAKVLLPLRRKRGEMVLIISDGNKARTRNWLHNSDTCIY